MANETVYTLAPSGYGFYNSQGSDRKYNASQFSTLFDGIINEGVFRNWGKEFKVTTAGTTTSVNIGSGLAWFDGTWTLLSDDATAFTIDQSGVQTGEQKYCAIFIKVDNDSRLNSITCKYGESAESNPPYPTVDSGCYVLAYVLCKGSSYTIDESCIVNVVGDDKTTPYSHGPTDIQTCTAKPNDSDGKDGDIRILVSSN